MWTRKPHPNPKPLEKLRIVDGGPFFPHDPSSVFLLLKPKDGRRRPGINKIMLEKGELIQELEQPHPPDEFSAQEHNYHVFNDTAVTLNCGALDVLPLEEAEHLYLLAVNTKNRMKEFNNEKKREYVIGLKMGDQVYFKIDDDASPGKGRIRYLGFVKNKDGVYLGVEIDEDDKFRGKGTTGLPYFECGNRNAMWLSMDMVVYPPPTAGQRVPHGRNTGENRPSNDSTGKHSTGQYTTTGASKSFHQGTVASKAWNFIAGSTEKIVGKDQQYPTSKLYKEGDRVVIYSMKTEQPIRATVRWTGRVQFSKESAMPSLMVAGLETDHLIDASEEFPQAYVNIGDQIRAKFKVERGHGKVYLPEQLLLTEAEYLHQKSMEQKQNAKELEVDWSHITSKELKGISFREQQQQFDEAKAEHERKLREKKKKHDCDISKTEENLVTRSRPSSPPGQHVDISAISAEELKEQRAMLEHFEQERKKSQTNATGSDKVSYMYTATPAVTYGAPGGAGMPRNVRAGNGSTCHHHSGDLPGYPERCVDHQQHDPHTRQEQYDCGRADCDLRHFSQQNVTDHNYNSKSGDGHGYLYTYHCQESNSRQHQPVGTNQLPPDSCNLAIKPSYCEISPATSTTLYHLPHAKMQNTSSDDHQHKLKERPTPAPRHTPIMDRQQQPEDQLPSWPTMDTVVVVRNVLLQNPVTGTVRFIGRIQGFDEFVVGLVLDNPMHGCTDGHFQGKRYFFCPPGRGYFCHISDIHSLDSLISPYRTENSVVPSIIPATTTGGGAFTKPLVKYSAYKKDDQIPEAVLISQYIGEGKGIQEHYSSCYFDSTVFGVFALSDAFDTMFLSEAKEGQSSPVTRLKEEYCTKTKHILWKGIVNPQRKNGVGRFETVIDLRNYLEQLGTVEGANKDENDPEEFLNMLFEKVLHVPPFLTIKRPLGVENEYFVQLLFEINTDQNVAPFTEELLGSLFKEQFTQRGDLQKTTDKTEAAREQVLEKKLIPAPQVESTETNKHTLTLLEEKTREIAQLKKENTSLQRWDSSRQSEITRLQAEIAHLKHINSLKLAEATRNVVHLQKDNDYWQREVARLQKDNDYKHREVTSLQEEVRQLQSKVEQQLKLGTDSDISFWLVNHEEIHSTGKVLGEGAWGKVTIGHYRGQNVAIKQLHSAIKSDFFDKLLRREISVMAKVRHPNLLLFIAAVLDTPSGSPIIITELLDTSLRHAYTNGQLTSKRVKVSILRDVAAALNYLHLQREPIIHRDVSSANVLLQVLPDNWWRGKLSDFGSANLARYATTPAAGALVYSAPEAFARGQQSPKIDVYSYGKLFCEVYTSKFPDPDAFPSLLQSVAREWPIIHQTITACVEDDPSNRPTMSSIVDQLNVFTR